MLERTFRVATWIAIASTTAWAHAQDLAPRAYLITPVHTNAVTLGDAWNDGNLLFGDGAPITDATARVHVPALSYFHSFGVAGRSANVTAILPYVVGHFRGTVLGAEMDAYRSGLMDAGLRLSVNLKGGPAMSPGEYRKWQHTTIVGASLRMTFPTGQYDPTKLINPGANRYAFRPEIGLSKRFGHYIVDAYAGVWLFTRNSDYFSRNPYYPGDQDRTQKPIGSIEAHLSYDFRPRLWVSLDGNFWYGGKTSSNGVENEASLQKNSRIGITTSLPLTRHQAIKLSYGRGAYIRFGGDLNVVSAAWQYSWVRQPKPAAGSGSD